jgi:hypothetical protein
MRWPLCWRLMSLRLLSLPEFPCFQAAFTSALAESQQPGSRSRLLHLGFFEPANLNVSHT